MRASQISLLLLLSFVMALSACLTFTSDEIRGDEGKVFHAGPSTPGIGSLYFGLYSDKTYQICSSGGIGQSCYSGNYELNKDTLTLKNLNKDIHLNSSRFLIKRYSEQDSTYWKWKYREYNNVHTWSEYKWEDSVIGGTGDVYQLNKQNETMKDDIHFIIRLDSLKTNN